MKNLMFTLFVLLQVQAVSVFAQTVHVTKTGSKYHSTGCQYLSRSDFSVELSKAKQQGLTACSRCNPLKTSSSLNESAKSSKPDKSNNENRTSTLGQCSATNKSGSKCARETKSPNGKCWQHGGN